MTANRINAALVAALLACGPAAAQTAGVIEDQRPPGLTGSNWQFGPLNRWAYTHLNEVVPSKTIRNDPQAVRPVPGLEGAANDLALTIDGTPTSLAQQMDRLYIDGVIALAKGEVRLERYGGTLAPERTHLLWSVSKTITGLVAGSVAADGLIDLDRSVADYVPALAASGWGADRLRDLLDMRDTSAWTEDYAAPDSTVRRQDCADGLLAGPDCEGIPVKGNYAFLAAVPRDPTRAGRFVYKSGTTDALAWVLENATGRRFADLVSERLWQAIGAERDAGIAVDTSGFTLASGGMHATLRDTARVGQLMLNRGRVGDRQVVPAPWFDAIFSDDGSRSWPDEAPDEERPYYKHFVWGLGDGRGTVQARGVHGQVIHVAPQAGIVIVMLSSWPDAEGGARGVSEAEQLRLLRAMETALQSAPSGA